MSFKSTSRVWLITGCSSGLGRALTRHVLAKGERVIVTARQPDQLSEFTETFPGTCRALPLDVTRSRQVTETVEAAHQAFGQLDVLVNNAGYGLIGALEECSDEQIWRNFNTNLFGPMRVMRAALPFLRAQRRGHIINISAAAAISNYAGFSVYGGPKCALEGVSEALALELRPLGIKVSLVQPGPFRTEFVRRSLDRAELSMVDYHSTSGKFSALLSRMDGAQPGNPVLAAEAIYQLSQLPDPPLRVPLGKYANDKVVKQAAALKAGVEAWQELAISTDFHPATA